MPDIGINTLNALGKRLAHEVRAFWQNTRICAPIIREGDFTLRLWEFFQKRFQAVGVPIRQINAEDPSCEITHRNPQPALVFFA